MEQKNNFKEENSWEEIFFFVPLDPSGEGTTNAINWLLTWPSKGKCKNFLILANKEVQNTFFQT